MPLCPNRHESRAVDFCEVCGVEMTPSTDASLPGSTGGEREICPACHAEHDAGTGDFCEVCGYNFKKGVSFIVAPPEPSLLPGPVETSAPPPPPTRWELVVTVAPNPHVSIPDEARPPRQPERVQALTADTFLIGRRSVRRQIEPDLALDHDDGVSHRHARLVRLPGGGFSLEDCGSSNGTTLNGTELKPGVPVALKAGDRVTLGRWTELTLRRHSSSDEVMPSLPNP